MPATTFGDISQRTAAWAATEMLRHATPVLVLEKFGQIKSMPKNKADTVKFRRPIPFGPATTPLQEGVTPNAQQIGYEDVTAQLQQYGAYVEITDKVEDLAEDPVLRDASQLSGEQAGITREMVTYGQVKGGTNVIYANGTSRSDVNTTVSQGKQRAVTRALHAQKARKITNVLSGSPNTATTPIEASYIAITHTDVESDIRNLPSFVPTAKYGSRNVASEHELGSADNVRYVISPELSPWEGAGSATLNGMKSVGGSNVDVYPVLYVGRDAYGMVPLRGAQAIEPKVLNPNTPRGGDPLGQRGTVGWKTWHAATILNQAWMVRLEVGVTDL